MRGVGRTRGAIVAILLAGCGGGEPPERAPAAEEAEAPATDLVHEGVWSPDGRRLVVTWDRGAGPRLYGLLAGSADAPPEPATGLPVSDGSGAWATWSPDGLWVAYGSGGDIWRVRPDGTGPERLTEGPAADAEPAYSPDGARIAFTSDASGEGPRLHVMDADGSDVREVLVRVGESHHHPAWDPGGRRLALQVREGAEDVIYLVDPSTGGTGRLGGGTHPAWSPDGARVYFSQNDSIFWRPPNGGSRRFVVADGRAPTADPSGTRLAFVRGEPPAAALHLLDLETGSDVRITP